MSLVTKLAVNLQAVRRKRNLSQERLAEKAGLSVSYISMLERGMRSPPLDTIELLSQALGVTPEMLLFSKSKREGTKPTPRR